MMTELEIKPTRTALYTGAIGMAAFSPFAAMASPRIAGWQIAWAALTAGGAWLLGRTRSHAVMLATAALIPVLYGPVVHETGGVEAPTFAWLVAMPLGLVVVFRAHQRALAIGALSSVLVAIVVCSLDSAPHALVFVRMLQVIVAAVLARVGSAAFARSEQREREAAAQLAASELRRERAERTVYLVKLATTLAHELNNPLGFMKSNIELVLGDAQEDDQREALIDSLGGIERIAHVVEELELLAAQKTASNRSPAGSGNRVVLALPQI